MWTLAVPGFPTHRTAMMPQQLREVAGEVFLLPSSCLAPVVGREIVSPSTANGLAQVDTFGDTLPSLPAPADAHFRAQQNSIADAFAQFCTETVGVRVRREVDDLLGQAVPADRTVSRDELKDNYDRRRSS
mmetsp:Transcript_43705/g.111722  ORF Transcript_43705/g.111722 Transcript_43705/m.111722 type:complete len:131 (-) Transcript_43705:334-726(-)